MRVAVIDDYEHAALTSADWSGLHVDVINERLQDDELLGRIQDAECLVVMRQRREITAEFIAALPRLRLIVTSGPRNASIDMDECRQRDIPVCATRYGPPSAAELTWALILCASRGVIAAAEGLRAGHWAQAHPGRDLAGRTLGVMGYGTLGRSVARYAQAFDMRVLAWSPHLTDERIGDDPVQRVSRGELLAESDFVSIHMVLSDQTTRMVTSDDFAQMRADAWFVNTSRAGLVDTEALHSALTTGVIAGAALDVFDEEPLPSHDRLLALPTVIATPHIGYVTEQTFQVWYQDIVEDIRSFLAGAPIRVL